MKKPEGGGQPDPDELVTVNRAASALGIDRRTVVRRVQAVGTPVAEFNKLGWPLYRFEDVLAAVKAEEGPGHRTSGFSKANGASKGSGPKGIVSATQRRSGGHSMAAEVDIAAGPLVTLGQAAKSLGLSVEMLESLIGEGLKVETKGKACRVRVSAVLRFLLDRETRVNRPYHRDNVRDARERKALLDGDHRQLQIDQTLGRLVPLQEIEEALVPGLLRLRSSLYGEVQTLAGDLARQKSPTVIAEMLREYLERSYNELTSALSESDRDPEGRRAASRSIRGAVRAADEARP